MLLVRLDRSVEGYPNLLALESKVELVVAVFQVKHALLGKELKHRLEDLSRHARARFNLRVGERVGRVELKKNARLVGRRHEEVFGRRVQRAKSDKCIQRVS